MSLAGLATQTCSVARALSVVGDAWSLMIVRELFLGSRRFDEFLAHTGISPHLLSVRLRGLEADGIVERRAYQERPLRHEYRLTGKGSDLWPVITALRQWADRWGEWPHGPPVKVRHRACGHLARAKSVCAACGDEMGPLDVDVVMSPPAREERRRAGTHRGAGAGTRPGKSARAKRS